MKTNKTLIYIAAYAVVGYVVYSYFFSKKHYAKIILNSGKYSGTINDLMSFDTSYVKAWSKAIKNGEPAFFLAGKSYDTETGKRQK